MGLSAWQIIVVVVLVVLLFGRGKISQLMGDAAKGINAFKRGMRDGEEDESGQRTIREDGPTVDARPSDQQRTGAGQRGES